MSNVLVKVKHCQTEELKHEKSVKQQLRSEMDSRLYESLKTALSHQHRLALLQDMSLVALKKIAASEHISIKGLRSKKAIIDAMLKIIEGRFHTLDEHKHVYIRDEFGLPQCGDDTPLNSAYIQARKKAINDIQRVINQDMKHDAITVEAREIADTKPLPKTSLVATEDSTPACDVHTIEIPDDPYTWRGESYQKNLAFDYFKGITVYEKKQALMIPSTKKIYSIR